MNLRKKKMLAARTLGVGIDRIVFARVDEVKEAITRQDIRDMVSSGIILVRDKKGRKRKEKIQRRRGAGKIKKKVGGRKRDYITITRKLREYVKQLMLQGKIDKEKYKTIRKQIRSKIFKSKSHFKESLKELK